MRKQVDLGLNLTTERTRQALTTDAEALRDCNIFIVTVPTPVDDTKRPDFTPLIRASQTIGHVLKRGDVVIYESTVYPGATEEICVPELERASGLACNRDFAVGYSPERINDDMGKAVLRNTRVFDLMREFEGLGMQVTVVDPWADAEAARVEYGVDIAAEMPAGQAFDAVVLAVAHRQFGRGEDERLSAILGNAAVVFDVKGQSAPDGSPVRL